jgi:regulator of replication initiation timing
MVLEGTQNFDEILMQLFMKKVRSELVVYQEELKILRLRYSILQEEEMANRERDLIMLIDEKRQASLAMSGELVSAKKQMDEFRTDYEILVADDKTLDKGFRREFADVSNMVADQLYKHFRKRPRGQKAKILDAAYDASSANPFSDRPSTAKRNEEAQRALDAAVHELDTHLPENMTVDPTVWERLCQYRREKIDCEARVKQKALILADMQAFVQRRHEEDERLKMEVEDLSEALNKLRSNRQIFFTDLEIQLLLKQGQVEVDPGKFIPDYRNCLLLHRSVVEDLNHQVKQLSDSKIASMVESKDFRKGIVQLEWEHKKMTMEMEDLQNRMRDIVSMKVTREIQCYLTDGDYDNKKVQEIAGLEQTIQVQKLQHERMVKEKKRTVKQIKRSIEEMMEKNDALMKELESLNVAVNERRHIHDISGEKKSDLDRKEHYREIVQRRRLVDLAKAQSQEVAILRAEVERLRMRTFAALVQVEH